VLTKPLREGWMKVSGPNEESKIVLPASQSEGHDAWRRLVELKVPSRGAGFTATGAARVVTGIDVIWSL
jgi:hypothetical protein